MMELNAEMRTKRRTGVEVTDVWNNIPSIDRAMVYNHDLASGEKRWNLVCLTHYYVKSYT